MPLFSAHLTFLFGFPPVPSVDTPGRSIKIPPGKKKMKRSLKQNLYFNNYSKGLNIWASLIAQLVKNTPATQETSVRFPGWEDPLERDRLPPPVYLGFPCGSAGKESACNVVDLGLIPRLGRSPGEGNGYPLQYSGLENPHGQRSLVCYSLWGHKQSDTTE